MPCPAALRLLLLTTVGALACAQAPTAGAQADPERPAEAAASVEAARAALARDDLDGAQALVRRGLRAAPADPTWLALRLRLLQRGVGYPRVDVLPQLRRARRAAVAREVLAGAPTDAVAHDELGRQALRAAALGLDLVKPTSPRWTLADVMTDDAAALSQTGLPARALRARFADSRFDLDALGALLPVLDASDDARRALRDAERHFRVALATADSALAAGTARRLARALVLGDDWRGLAALGAARRPSDYRGDLWTGLAAFQLGALEAGGEALARGLAAAPAEVVARYRDLAPLLTEEQAAAWRADPDAFAAAYWLEQDLQLSTPVNERRVEHRARVAEADLRFAPGGAASARGSVWVRYGKPTARRVVSDVAYAGDSRDGLYDVWEYPGHRLVFRDAEREGAYRLYSPPASAFGDLATAAQAEGDDSVARDRALRRDDPARSVLGVARFEMPTLVSVLRGTDGEPAEIVVAYGVPLVDAREASRAVRAEAAAFVLAPGADTPAAEHRRSFETLPAAGVVALPSLTVWAGAEQLAVPDGPSTVVVEVEAEGRLGASRQPITVPAPTAGLALSDVVLAYLVEDSPGSASGAGSGGTVSRRGLRIVPAPVAAFDRAAPFWVYVEVYGLGLRDGATDYTFEAALVPRDTRPALRRALDGLLGRAREAGVATEARASGDRPTDEQYVALDASGVPAGRYTLVVRVRDAVGDADVVAEREVLLE